MYADSTPRSAGGQVVSSAQSKRGSPVRADPHRPADLAQPGRDAASGLSIASEYKCCRHATKSMHQREDRT
jgi:hypothetical protein